MLIALRVGCILGFFLFSANAFAQMTFPWARHTIDNTSFGADGTKTYFANQDSLPDIISGWEQGNVTRLYFHPGKPTQKWPYVEVPSPAVEDALLADLDEDGFPDIITLSEGQHQRITVHWAPNNWQQYQQSSAWQSVNIPCTIQATQWMFGVAHQVDGVNGLDLIVGSKNKGGTLGWLEAPANPRIVDQWQFYEISPAGWIMSIEIVDVNRDGYSDILISDRKGNNRGVRWLEYPAQQDKLRAQWNNHIIGLTQGEPMFLTTVVTSKAGLTDIYAASLSDYIFHFTATSDDWAQDSITFPAEAGTRGKSVAVGNVNHDGSIDLVTTYEGADRKHGVMLSLANDSGWQHYPISDTLGRKFDFAKLIDLDQDGDLDVLTSEENNNSATQGGLGVIWYENPSKPEKHP
ncbi:MAG: VCBS repeat-containing protein [Bacteroidota bacterium]